MQGILYENIKQDFTEIPLKISIGVQKGSTLPVYQYNSDGILLKQ